MRKWICTLGVVLLVLMGTGCGIQASNAATDADKTAKADAKPREEEQVIIPIQAELPRRGDVSLHFETTTRVDAENRVQVVAEAIGECVKVVAQEGDHVKAGQVLAEINKSEAQATLGQPEVHVRQSKTALDIAEKSLAEGIGAKAERDNAQFAYEQAVATLNMQKVNLDRLTIKSPINGVVTRKNIQEGQVIATGVPVFNIVDPSSFMLTINPPEKELARLKIGQ
ncbi:MAG: efflux RND transporter periplasmic adaptor subunit, partial [Candidatus Hydrogenedentes bacterium]|nr:efflux RND transporter periplasmic adaptor subunit [Candidatus Hydrogenedentota bacterium]